MTIHHNRVFCENIAWILTCHIIIHFENLKSQLPVVVVAIIKKKKVLEVSLFLFRMDQV